jgi:hypothetical protein
MVSGQDRVLGKGVEIKFPYLDRFVASYGIFEREFAHLVEVAVVDFAIPTDVDRVAAHQAVDRAGIEMCPQQLEILPEFAVALQVGSKARDRHVRDAVERVEVDVEMLFHLALVISFEIYLIGWEEGSVRIVDEVENQSWIASVAKFIQFLKGRDAAIKNAVAALLVHIVGSVARHACDDFDFVFSEEFRNPFVSGLINDRGIEPVHNATRLRKIANCRNESPKVRNHFRSSSSQVERWNVSPLIPFQNLIDRFTGHDFFPLWSGVHMAVYAGQIAKLACVELKNLCLCPAKRRGSSLKGEFKVVFPFGNYHVKIWWDEMVSRNLLVSLADSVLGARKIESEKGKLFLGNGASLVTVLR